MLHDIILLIAILVLSYIAAMVCFVFHRPERFDTKREWWAAEGLMIFFVACVGLLILALLGHFFHSLR